MRSNLLIPVQSIHFRLLTALAAAAIVWPGVSQGATPQAQNEARAIFSSSGVKGGVVLHLGSGQGDLTAAVRAGPEYQVQGLERDASQVEKARESLYQAGLHGAVAVEVWRGNTLPYIDNFINLVVAEKLDGVDLKEVLRVLVPNGVVCLKQNGQWQKTVKPRPAEMDDWTHYYYDAHGNATSKDMLVGPPERLQWVGNPRWSRHHDRMSSLSAQVTAGGRLFYIMDEGSRISILLPSKWNLIARDAFNGTILWKRPIDKWNPHLWPLKSGPTQLARRLVAVGDEVYVTLGIGEPISLLDPATGKTRQTLPGTRGTEEMIVVNGILYALVNPDFWSLEDFAPKHNTGDQRRVETEFNWDEKKRLLVAVDLAANKMLWKQEAKVAPLTLAADGKRLVFHDGEKLVNVNPANGQTVWRTESVAKRKLFEYNYGPRVLLYQDVVLYAGGDGAMKGFNALSGKELWSAPHQKSGYRSPEDLIVAAGLVWNAPTISGGMSGEFTGRDPLTGQTKSEFPPDIDTYWFHHRCYIAKATERFIMPSRTGIEFVDLQKKHWDINHWVRAACLYGIVPANGLVYAGPHNCACYPEAKLDGMNALAAGTYSPHPKTLPDAERLERGPAFGQPLAETEADAKDWPTYRHDAKRSGFTSQPLLENLGQAWEVSLPGRLSATTVAAGKVFVAQVDQHVVHALDADTGKALWHFLAGGRVDSPPTYWKGRVVFGCKDGYMYCLRASDGALLYRYLAAGAVRRHGAHEQVESVWPVHGSVVVENGIASLVAGRSVFLDGGLRFVRIEVATGKKLVETIFDDKDPETGRDLQERVKTLQMPVGLNDILSSDGQFMYLRSQKINMDGKRVDIGPISGNAAEQGGSQRGPGAHIFAPMGYLDDSWFHRSYWVYGKSFAGGHNGYYQAGKYTPSGQILVFDDKNVYGYGRLPQYLKWTTTMENQLFSAPREAPDVPVVPVVSGAKKKAGKKAGNKAAAEPATAAHPVVRFEDSPKLDPSGKPLTVIVWVQPRAMDGVIVSHGGGNHGFALTLEDGKPAFTICANKERFLAEAARPLSQGWHQLAGVLTPENRLLLFVDGELAAQGKAGGMIPKKPNQGLFLGASSASLVSTHGKGAPYQGLMDQLTIAYRAMDISEIIGQGSRVNEMAKSPEVVVACAFDNGSARDDSGNNHNGIMQGVTADKGKFGMALSFGQAAPEASAKTAPAAGKSLPPALAAAAKSGSFVEHQWDRNVPMFARAMAMAGKTMFVSGPPDLIDEEYAFEKLVSKDKDIQAELARQDAALNGKEGAILWAVTAEKGNMGQEIKLNGLPVWDGMAVAQGRLYVSTQNGKVQCFGRAQK